MATHAAAPCPVEVKEQMIAWWGPIIEEYYAGTENIGSTSITSAEWLEHKGSVGRPSYGAVIHICDDEGRELPAGGIGTVYFEDTASTFEYHGDREKTSSVAHPEHPSWRTLGDVGRVDADGYLYLTDRRAFMIVSGGVNIYPQEIEDVLVAHPKVLDVAVFGIPNDDMGEEVKAVVQPVDGTDAGAALAEELDAWCEERLAGFKRPRSYDFVEQLPRLDNGKLYKKVAARPLLGRPADAGGLMDLNLSEEQQQLVDTFSSLYAKESTGERVRAAEPSGYDAALWERLLETGVVEMAVDEGSGGWGATLLDLALVAEQHGRHLGSAPLIEAQTAAPPAGPGGHRGRPGDARAGARRAPSW